MAKVADPRDIALRLTAQYPILGTALEGRDGRRSDLGAVVSVVRAGSLSVLSSAAQQMLDNPEESARRAIAAQEMMNSNYAVKNGASELASAHLVAGS